MLSWKNWELPRAAMVSNGLWVWVRYQARAVATVDAQTALAV